MIGESLLNKEYILSKISADQIFSYYLGSNFCVGKAISSPLRVDSLPSFTLFYHSSGGNLLYKDHATGEFGDCFKFVQNLFNLGYTQTFKKIKNDLLENIPSTGNISNNNIPYNSNEYRNKQKDKSKETSRIEYIKKEFSRKDLEYWKNYGITQSNLDYFNIKVAQEVLYEGKTWLKYSISNPIFVYQVGNQYKFYKPLAAKGYKWYGNMSSYTLLGLDLIPDNYNKLIIIEKAYKDVVCIHNFEYVSTCFSGESVLLTQDLLDKILVKSDKLFYLGDNDDCGKRCLARMNEFGIPGYLIKERVKDRRADISDCYKYYGKEKVQEILNSLNYGNFSR